MLSYTMHYSTMSDRGDYFEGKDAEQTKKIKDVQTKLGVKADGLFGSGSLAALNAFLKKKYSLLQVAKDFENLHALLEKVPAEQLPKTKPSINFWTTRNKWIAGIAGSALALFGISRLAKRQPKSNAQYMGLGGGKPRPKRERLCLINMETEVVKSVHASLTAATNADMKTPFMTHYIAECKPGWKKGTRIPGSYGKKWTKVRKLLV